MDSNYILVGFPAITGKILILGNSVAFGSMEKGFFYVDNGNDFWKLLDYAFYNGESKFETLRVEYRDGNEQSRIATKQKFMKLLKDNNVGLSDVISKCENETKSQDKTIVVETIEYNDQLPKLIQKCDVIIINGLTDTSDNFRKAKQKYGIDTSSKKIFLVSSSSNYRGLTSTKKDERKKEWKKALCWYSDNNLKNN